MLFVLFTPLVFQYSFSLSLPKIASHLFLFHPLIYSLRWVDALWLSSGLTRVGGVQINYSWHEYALLRTVVMALELVPTSKRLLGNGIPQGNIRLSRIQAVPNKHTLDQVNVDRLVLASGMLKTRWAQLNTWAQLGPWSAFRPRSKVRREWDNVLYYKAWAQGSMGLGPFPIQ